MLRNCLKTLLCVLLVLMLPLCALADVQHSLKVIPGSGMGPDQAVADLMDAISLKLTQGAKSGALTIALAYLIWKKRGTILDPPGTDLSGAEDKEEKPPVETESQDSDDEYMLKF